MTTPVGHCWHRPSKITADMKSVYTLRTTTSMAKPVFLGKWGEIYTFNSLKTLVRWIMENDDHDLARVSTWEELVSAANSRELKASVHPDNQYTFNGIVRDIEGRRPSMLTRWAAATRCVPTPQTGLATTPSTPTCWKNPLPGLPGLYAGLHRARWLHPSKPYNHHAEAWKGLEDDAHQAPPASKEPPGCGEGRR